MTGALLDTVVNILATLALALAVFDGLRARRWTAAFLGPVPFARSFRPVNLWRVPLDDPAHEARRAAALRHGGRAVVELTLALVLAAL